MVAFEEDLAAAADAHELVADLGEAGGGIVSAGKEEDGEREEDAMKGVTRERVWF